MKSLWLALSVSTLSTFAVSSASAEVVFNDAAVTASHDCSKDPEVSINGSSSTFTLTGACTKVAITGSMNKTTIESAEKVAVSGSMNEVSVGAANKIAVTGSSNQVRWKKGIKSAKPKVSSVGTGNKISQDK
jgi:hypothetical protein